MKLQRMTNARLMKMSNDELISLIQELARENITLLNSLAELKIQLGDFQLMIERDKENEFRFEAEVDTRKMAERTSYYE